ncbi:hypothetical protein TNCV_3578671 [Trichonephila clavipes]|nr:hypothetical protein TNCV_3578671 [Trichonephila clavipes]
MSENHHKSLSKHYHGTNVEGPQCKPERRMETGNNWTFQQDSAHTHKAEVQRECTRLVRTNKKGGLSAAQIIINLIIKCVEYWMQMCVKTDKPTRSVLNVV